MLGLAERSWRGNRLFWSLWPNYFFSNWLSWLHDVDFKYCMTYKSSMFSCAGKMCHALPCPRWDRLVYRLRVCRAGNVCSAGAIKPFPLLCLFCIIGVYSSANVWGCSGSSHRSYCIYYDPTGVSPPHSQTRRRRVSVLGPLYGSKLLWGACPALVCLWPSYRSRELCIIRRWLRLWFCPCLAGLYSFGRDRLVSCW